MTLRIDALARAVVTPPHLPAKSSGFYAGMHRSFRPGQRGPRGEWLTDSSMHRYAPWLCALGVATIKNLLLLGWLERHRQWGGVSR